MLNQLKKAHSTPDNATTQFITPVICELKTKKNGFILPIPKIPGNTYDYTKTLYHKGYKGYPSAVVLTRQTRALQIDQAIFQAFMALVSGGVVAAGVIGAIAITMALTIMATVSAAAVAIPVVG